MGLRIKDTYTSLQPRGKFSGFPTTFVHFGKGGKKKSISTVITDINKMKNSHVCLTGIRPLEQEECISLVYELVERRNVQVYVQTDCRTIIEDTRASRSFHYSVEILCPTSGMEIDNHYANLRALSPKDEVSFCIDSIEDYVFAKGILKKYQPKAAVYFTSNTAIADVQQWLIEDKLTNVRYGDQ